MLGFVLRVHLELPDGRIDTRRAGRPIACFDGRMRAASRQGTGSAGHHLELAYRVGIALKGFDGLVELVAGLILWLAPAIPAALLEPLELTDAGDGTVRVQIAEWVGRFDAGLAGGPAPLVVFFLLSHGLVKIVLVYCLLKEYHWVYPYALAALGAFAAYQAYALARAPGFGLAVLLLLDLVIIWLVWREWRMLRQRKR